MFEASVIVANESLSCPQCERCISKSYSHCWKGFKYTKMLEKPKNLWELKDFSEDQQAV